MSRFIKNILLLFSPLLAVLFSVELYISSELNKGKRYFFQADWHDLKNHHSDILLVGNSRIWVHMDPFAIKDKTGLAAEVIGQDGQGAQILWLKLKQYTRHNKNPRSIFLQFDPFFLSGRNDLYGIENFRTGFFFDRINLTSLSSFDGYAWYFRYFPLAALDFNLLRKILYSETIKEDESFSRARGFKKMHLPWEGDWRRPESITVQPRNSYIDSFFVYCKKKNIKLYALYTPQSYPSYVKVKNSNFLATEISSLNERYNMNVPLLNYNSEKYYNDSSLFYNHMHLNAKGVDFFMHHQFLVDSTIFWE